MTGHFSYRRAYFTLNYQDKGWIRFDDVHSKRSRKWQLKWHMEEGDDGIDPDCRFKYSDP